MQDNEKHELWKALDAQGITLSNTQIDAVILAAKQYFSDIEWKPLNADKDNVFAACSCGLPNVGHCQLSCKNR